MTRKGRIFRALSALILLFLLGVVIFFTVKSFAISNETNSGLFTLVIRALTSSKIPKVDVDQAAREQHEVVFVDAREKNEYNVSHIKNAIFAGASNFDMSMLGEVNKSAPIIVYCSVGVRSDKATKKLLDAGYTNVKNLFGGIFEWINEGNPVFNQQGKRVDSVHAFSPFWGQFVHGVHKIYNVQ